MGANYTFGEINFNPDKRMKEKIIEILKPKLLAYKKCKKGTVDEYNHELSIAESVEEIIQSSLPSNKCNCSKCDPDSFEDFYK